MARPGFSICLCPDSRLMRNQVERLLASSPPASAAQWEREVYWGDEPLPPAFWETLTLQGLFSTPTALIVNNAQNVPAENWKRLSAALAGARSETWPFFCMPVEFDKNGPKVPAHISKLACFSFAEKQQWIWTSPGLSARNKLQFMQEEAKRLGVTFAPGLADLLQRILPADATAISLELEKLALAAGSDGVIPLETADLVDHEPEQDIFSLMRNLQQGGNVLAAWQQVMASSRSADALTFSFLAVLAREARQLWQLLAGDPVYLPASVLAAKKSLAQSLGYPGIARIWHLALEADKGVKSGERSTDQALEGVAAGLLALFQSRRGR